MHNLYCNIDYIKEDLQLLLNLFGEYKKDLEVTFEIHVDKACITINGQPQEYKLESYKRSKETSYEYGEMYEKITFTDWLESVLK